MEKTVKHFRRNLADLDALGNTPVTYTAFDGWVRDRFGKIWMRYGEALPAEFLRCSKLTPGTLGFVTRQRFILD